MVASAYLLGFWFKLGLLDVGVVRLLFALALSLPFLSYFLSYYKCLLFSFIEVIAYVCVCHRQ